MGAVSVAKVLDLCRRKVEACYGEESEFEATFQQGQMIIRNTMSVEPEISVVATLLDPKSKDFEKNFEGMELVTDRQGVLREDYLPFVGREVVRSFFFAEDEIWLPEVGTLQQRAIIISNKFVVHLTPGERRRPPKLEIDPDFISDMMAAACGT